MNFITTAVVRNNLTGNLYTQTNELFPKTINIKFLNKILGDKYKLINIRPDLTRHIKKLFDLPIIYINYKFKKDDKILMLVPERKTSRYLTRKLNYKMEFRYFLCKVKEGKTEIFDKDDCQFNNYNFYY